MDTARFIVPPEPAQYSPNGAPVQRLPSWGNALIQARRILETLRRHHVSHVVALPDNASAALLSLLATADGPRMVAVTREGEAFAVASGLWVGGAVPLVLIQNTGLLESGDALRG